ncbi:MAG: hypothetical protein HZA64_12750 [Rhodocyclales bacterium]|nr:hypothetical protein [Rhodocyclales bacterium]MBI5786316.1 hypothetical protein [Rhodocyclales bacterium]
MAEAPDTIATLKAKLEVTAGVADRLAYSVKHVRSLGLAPLTLTGLAALGDGEMEVLDAFIYRYGSLVSNIQDSIFKSIGEAEQEPVNAMSNRDKANLMEKLGALPSATAFATLAVIRNRLMHDYPEEAQKQIDRMNFIIDEAPRLLAVFLGIAGFVRKFGVAFSPAEFVHLTDFSPIRK